MNCHHWPRIQLTWYHDIILHVNKTLPGLPSERSCVNNVLGQNHPGSTPLYLSWSWQILDTDTQNICISGLHFPENLLPGSWSRIKEYWLCNSLYDSPEFKNPFPVGQPFSSVIQSCPTLRDPMNRSTPGLPVRHQLPESTQTHVHCVGDAIQPSHPL